jgi:hypothetical protein
MKPATPLPWPKDNIVGLNMNWENQAYIAHACNAYPKLVEALRKIKERTDCSRDFGAAAEAAYITSTVLAELGEQP